MRRKNYGVWCKKPNHWYKPEKLTVFGNRGRYHPGYFASVLDHFGSVFVLELKQEISDRSLDVDVHGCSIDHTLSEHAEGDFHLGSVFGPDTLRHIRNAVSLLMS